MAHPFIKLSALFAAACGILLLVYPWRIYYGNFHAGLFKTASSYVVVAALMSCAGALLAPWAVHRIAGGIRGPVVAILVAGTTFLLLLLLTGLFSGPGLFLNIPGTRVQGIFFAEWNFVTFLMYVALPFSVASGVLARWRAQ
jgi:hypothetical protein